MEVSTLSPRTRARGVGLVVLAVIVGIWIAYLTTSDDPRDRSADDWIALGILVVVLAVIWRFVVVGPLQRAEGNTPAKVGLIIGILGVLGNGLFWSGLPFVLGAGALVLGIEGRKRSAIGYGRAGMAQWALILGAVAVVGWIVLSIIG